MQATGESGTLFIEESNPMKETLILLVYSALITLAAFAWSHDITVHEVKKTEIRLCYEHDGVWSNGKCEIVVLPLEKEKQ